MIRAADPQPRDDALSAEAWRVIRRTARRLVRRAEFNRCDRDDIEQELALAVWSGLERFDPTVGPEGALVTTIVRRAAATLVRQRGAQRRDDRRAVSLPLDDPRDELGACLAYDDGHERAVDTAHDVTTLVAGLPADLRAIADELGRASVSEAARNLKISRATICRKIAELRAHFEADEQEKTV
jgi:RNA polymerase sigma factor (sigma-70 family)